MKTTSHPHFMTSGTPSHTFMNFVIWVNGYIFCQVFKSLFLNVLMIIAILQPSTLLFIIILHQNTET